MFNLLQILILFAATAFASPVEDVDFNKDILPIFRQHCFECHGEGNTEGELSLDSLSGILQGGHTSSPLLTSNLANSELYLRITSLSAGYKMPKNGPPLNQQEIDKIGQWIGRVTTQDGSSQTPERVEDLSSAPSSVEPGLYGDASSKPLVSTPNPVVSSTPSPTREPKSSGLTAMLENMEPDQVATFLLGSAFLIVLLGWIGYKLSLGRPHKRRMSRDGDRVMALLSMIIGTLSSLMLFGMAYLHWRNGKLYSENKSLREQVQLNNAFKAAPLIEINEASLPLAPHPMHPPRLGGQYYRGNDERNDMLFNRGFYRTATIDLHVVDASGKRIQWNDEVSDKLEIEIQIQRAPKATRELFTERVRTGATLEHYCETNKDANRKLMFVAVEKEQLWKARIPLPSQDKWSDGNVKGMVYLMFGVQPQAQLPRPHFAVRYDLNLRNGKVSEDSVLWMGSMYTLGNRVLVPDEDKILLDRWFDWRPIPIIEGDASSDPALLGVEEHQ